MGSKSLVTAYREILGDSFYEFYYPPRQMLTQVCGALLRQLQVSSLAMHLLVLCLQRALRLARCVAHGVVEQSVGYLPGNALARACQLIVLRAHILAYRYSTCIHNASEYALKDRHRQLIGSDTCMHAYMHTLHTYTLSCTQHDTIPTITNTGVRLDITETGSNVALHALLETHP
jgi:hypothetical protein